MIIIEDIGSQIKDIFKYIEYITTIKDLSENSNEHTRFIMIDRRSLNKPDESKKFPNSILHKNSLLLCEIPNENLVSEALEKNPNKPFHKKLKKTYYIDCSDNQMRAALNDVIVYKIYDDKIEELKNLFELFKLIKTVS